MDYSTPQVWRPASRILPGRTVCGEREAAIGASARLRQLSRHARTRRPQGHGGVGDRRARAEDVTLERRLRRRWRGCGHDGGTECEETEPNFGVIVIGRQPCPSLMTIEFSNRQCGCAGRRRQLA